jgi:DNA-binding MarR family transcriptional regulator
MPGLKLGTVCGTPCRAPRDAYAHTPAGAVATELIVETFRLNGRLLEAGDDLVRDVGLTSARWQVLGAIVASANPLPVSHIARNMGLTRQAVQRLANDLGRNGLVRFAPNPHHERARLLAMTDSGAKAFKTAMARQVPWVNRLAKGMDPDDIAAAVRVLGRLRRQLDAEPAAVRSLRRSARS